MYTCISLCFKQFFSEARGYTYTYVQFQRIDIKKTEEKERDQNYVKRYYIGA